MKHNILVRAFAETAGISGEVLVTRTYGHRFLEALDATLSEISAERLIILDFRDVEIMDASFVDEVFSILATRNAKRVGLRRYLLLQTLSLHLMENLAITLSSRPQREPGLRNCVLPFVDADRQVRLVAYPASSQCSPGGRYVWPGNSCCKYTAQSIARVAVSCSEGNA